MLIPGVALLTALLVGLAQPYPVPDTDTVYGNGLVFEAADGHHFTTHQQQGADLVLPTGAVVAWDAFVVIGAQAFERTVDPGRYRVTLTVTDDDQHESASRSRGSISVMRSRCAGKRRQPGADPASASYGSTRVPGHSWTPRSPSSPPRTSTSTATRCSNT